MIPVSVSSSTGPRIVGAQRAAPRGRRLLGTLLMTVAACSSGPGAEHATPVAALAVSPKSLVVRVGQTAQLTAVPLDAHGTPLAGRAVTWATSDSSVASVTTGQVVGRAAGRATITATSEGRTGTAGVVVEAPGATQPGPTLLPEATPSQAPLTGLYDLLHVPALAPGDSYLDPSTGVTIYRLTSATFPTTRDRKSTRLNSSHGYISYAV